MLDLVRKNTESFLIEGLIDTHSTKDFIRFLYHAKEKKSTFQHNLTQYASFSRILGILPGVFSVPSDIELLSSPNERRRFLNIDLAQKDPFYVHHLLRYNRAMKQRNALLRKMAFAAIDPWEREMAKSAAYITKKRQLFLENMEKPFIQYMQKLSAEDEVRYLFTPSIAVSEQIEQKYLHMLHKSRHKEAHVGYTLKGPHRDDFICQINGIDSKSFSQGQKCSIVLAMRLAQREELAKNVGHPIVFCIDDFGMGLDSARKKQLQKVLEDVRDKAAQKTLCDAYNQFMITYASTTYRVK